MAKSVMIYSCALIFAQLVAAGQKIVFAAQSYPLLPLFIHHD